MSDFVLMFHVTVPPAGVLGTSNFKDQRKIFPFAVQLCS